MDHLNFKKSFLKLFLCILLLLLSLGIIYGGFIAILYTSFNGRAYLSIGIILLIIALLSYLWILALRKKKSSSLHKGMLIFLAILGITMGGFEIYHQVQNSIEVVGDGSLILADYIPFQPNSKLVTLSSPATLLLKENLPKVDGATALFPIYSAFVQAVYPKEDYSIYYHVPTYLEFTEEEEKHLENDTSISLKQINHLKCTKTNIAYERLIRGEVDIIFCAGPSKRQLEMAENLGVTMKLTPIGKEAFVFFVNQKNPIDELSIEQIQGIYSGTITNWSDLGGNASPIKAFQRPENSGSQTALERLMDGKVLISPLQDEVIGGMGGIIHQTASYKNYKNAIGYSFRYFSMEMVQNNKIKHLKLDGIAPTKDTIRNGTYPITNYFYAITLEGNSNPNIPLFLEWILSPQGQSIIEETGYVGI